MTIIDINGNQVFVSFYSCWSFIRHKWCFCSPGFRSGIVIITEYLELFLSSQPNFLFFLITLSIALVFVHYSRSLIKGKAFQSVSDSIYLAHKFNNEQSQSGSGEYNCSFFFCASGGAGWPVWSRIILERP